MNYDINKATGVTTEGFEILCILDYFVYAITFRNRKYRLYSAIVHLMYILFCRKKYSALSDWLLNEQVYIFHEPYNAPTYFDNHKKGIQ